MKKIVKQLFALLGFHISKIPPIALNMDDPFEMQKHLIKDKIGSLTIFDVGAYIGQVALQYNDLFPNSTIYCFEPFPNSYFQLKENTSHFTNIIPVNKGVAEFSGISKFNSNNSAPTNSLLQTHEQGNETWGPGLLTTIESVDVELTSIDSFVETNNILNIDILKLDVQGSEYMVINGAKNSLRKGIIQMIYTEIITLPTYKEQKQFDEIVSLLRSFDFELFNLYNHSLTAKGQLRQVDAIFIRSNILQDNKN